MNIQEYIIFLNIIKQKEIIILYLAIKINANSIIKIFDIKLN